MAQLKNTNINDTGFLQLPAGNSAQRTTTPQSGMIRFNTEKGHAEWYNDVANEWVPFDQFSSVVAKGGTQSRFTLNGETFAVHTFTASGTFEVFSAIEVDVLVVGGGGSGGEVAECSSGVAGGGGA